MTAQRQHLVDRAALRWVWRLGGSALAVLLLGVGTLQLVSRLAHSTETVVSRFPDAELTSVQVSFDSGSVRIVATDRADVVVTARLDHGLVPTRSTATLGAGGLAVDSDCNLLLSSFCRAEYTIEVPASADLRSVRISGLNGGVTAQDLSATELDLATRNGDIRASLASPPELLEASTRNGDVEVVVPRDDGSYVLDLSTRHGSVEREVRTDPDGDRHVRARSATGDIIVRYRR